VVAVAHAMAVAMSVTMAVTVTMSVAVSSAAVTMPVAVSVAVTSAAVMASAVSPVMLAVVLGSSVVAPAMGLGMLAAVLGRTVMAPAVSHSMLTATALLAGRKAAARPAAFHSQAPSLLVFRAGSLAGLLQMLLEVLLHNNGLAGRSPLGLLDFLLDKDALPEADLGLLEDRLPDNGALAAIEALARRSRLQLVAPGGSPASLLGLVLLRVLLVLLDNN